MTVAPVRMQSFKWTTATRARCNRQFRRSLRHPWIVEAAPKNREKRYVLGGEAVVPGVDRLSDFNALHSDKVQLCAFDC
jgi:hypothetical protein